MTAPKKPKKPRTRRTQTRAQDWKPAWIEAFRETRTVKDACAVTGVGRSTVYEHREFDEEFAAAWIEAEDEMVEAMEGELYRRAVDGVEKPVFQGGKLVGHVQEFSDALLMFGLKARRPGVYRDNVKVEHSGPDGGPIELEAPADDTDRATRAALLLRDAGLLKGAGSNGNGHVTNGNGNGHR